MAPHSARKALAVLAQWPQATEIDSSRSCSKNVSQNSWASPASVPTNLFMAVRNIQASLPTAAHCIICSFLLPNVGNALEERLMEESKTAFHYRATTGLMLYTILLKWSISHIVDRFPPNVIYLRTAIKKYENIHQHFVCID